jgi:large subunit ribosomal protein L35
MPKVKTRSGAKKKFKVTGTGKILRRKRHRTAAPGVLVQARPGKKKRRQENEVLAPSDAKVVKKMLGI